MACSNNVEVTVADQVTVSVSATGCDGTVALIGEVAWKQVAIQVAEPTQRVYHEKLKRSTIGFFVYPDGNTLRWEKAGVVRETNVDGTFTGWLDFTAAGITIQDEVIFEHK